MYRLLPRLTATKLQATSYLLGVSLFSISFLVFLNASISFVVTDIIGKKHGVGDAVGTLGFADELLALVACPLWGIVSDRVGVRLVALAGYSIIAFSLICLVQSKHVYPDLLIFRLLFSVGGAACSTMVTAILPAMTARTESGESEDQTQNIPRRGTERAQSEGNVNRHSLALSVSSELTITPARFESRSQSYSHIPRTRRSLPADVSDDLDPTEEEPDSNTSQIAGFVGLFTGLGALLAVVVFLRLPTAFGASASRGLALQESFYVVGVLSLIVGVCVYFGLRGLPGEHDKGLHTLFAYAPASRTKIDGDSERDIVTAAPTYLELTRSAIVLGFSDTNIALGYLGGFVARASSVGISLMIPLFVNAYFVREGLCTGDPTEEIKSGCKRAYTLASMLTGISQLVALLAAPLFGVFNARVSKRRYTSNVPLGLGAVLGIFGCVGFGLLRNPDPFAKDHGGRWAILSVILLGLSQIGAIVCSLGLLSRGIQSSSPAAKRTSVSGTSNGATTAPNEALAQTSETAPLLPSRTDAPADTAHSDRTHLKGSIAGVYSLAGGAGILLLTKVGGYAFDKASPGAPFFILASFNGLLLLAIVAITGGKRLRDQAVKGHERHNA